MIPDEIYREACVYTTEEAIASCQVVGYPAMIKASWGGGGKGIRKVCFMHDSFALLFFLRETNLLIKKNDTIKVDKWSTSNKKKGSRKRKIFHFSSELILFS